MEVRVPTQSPIDHVTSHDVFTQLSATRIYPVLECKLSDVGSLPPLYGSPNYMYPVFFFFKLFITCMHHQYLTMLYMQSISYCTFLQLASGQCLLTVEMHQFQNLHSVVIRNQNRPFCCCDNITLCVKNLENTTCGPHCDTSFVVTRMSENEDSDPYPLSMFSDDFKNSPATNTNLSTFHFVIENSTTLQSVRVQVG